MDKIKELNLLKPNRDLTMTGNLLNFFTLKNIGRALKALALLTFLVFFFILMQDIWMKFNAKMTTFGIRYFRHDNLTKRLPSVTFCPLPGKDFNALRVSGRL